MKDAKHTPGPEGRRGVVLVHRTASYDPTAKNEDRAVAIPVSAIAAVKPGARNGSVVLLLSDRFYEVVEDFEEVLGMLSDEAREDRELARGGFSGSIDAGAVRPEALPELFAAADAVAQVPAFARLRAALRAVRGE